MKRTPIAMILLLGACHLLIGCTPKPAIPKPQTDPLYTIAVQIDRSAIGLKQAYIIRAALVSDGALGAEAAARVQSALARVVSVTKRFRAAAAGYSDFASGQIELAALFDELLTVTSSLAVDFGLSQEVAARIEPIARFVFQTLEALRPLFRQTRAASSPTVKLPLETIAALISAVAAVKQYEDGRASLTTSQIFERARATLADAR